ncbi:hypothetical protein LXL04_037042 [Taraxacum kok-saghyz]
MQTPDTPLETSPMADDDTPSLQTNPQDFQKSLHGCNHYRRRCKIRAPCCNQIFFCRHCHNEATSALANPKERHEIVRHDIKQVICAICNTEQQVAHICINCGVKMGEYFCGICKFYDDDVNTKHHLSFILFYSIENKRFQKNSFIAMTVGYVELEALRNSSIAKSVVWRSCYDVSLRDIHACLENSTKNHCPICYEFIFDSTKGATIIKCGHTMHLDCYEEMIIKNQYRCPICSKSMCNMSRTWQRLDQEIEATAMPEEYRYEASLY